MVTLKDYIIENKLVDGQLQQIMSQFKEQKDQILSMIAKRIEKWDANSGINSQKPMFLCDYKHQYISWETIDTLSINLGDNDENVDARNYKLFDGFLTEYINGEETKNGQYVLGVFIDRCFIPIFDKVTFDKIWNKLV